MFLSFVGEIGTKEVISDVNIRLCVLSWWSGLLCDGAGPEGGGEITGEASSWGERMIGLVGKADRHRIKTMERSGPLGAEASWPAALFWVCL